MSNHTFNPFIAKKYGVIEAVLINTLVFWTSTNAAKESNYHNERYWCYGTSEYFAKFFMYLTARQIKYALANLVKSGALLRNKFNKKKYDQTNWYALSDCVLAELNLDRTCLQPANCTSFQSNCTSLQPAPPLDVHIHDASTTHTSTDRPSLDRLSSTKFVRPIPVNKTVNKQTTKILSATDVAQAHEENTFDEFWKTYPVKKNKVRAKKIWDKNKLSMLVTLICCDVMTRSQKDSQWQDKRYIPHPATYLGNRLWEDEITQDSSPPKKSSGDAFSRAMSSIHNTLGNTYDEHGNDIQPFG